MYYKKVDYNSNKECFDFLANHFEYDTMNPWNALRSIAHNVKIYNLPVDYDEAMEALERDDYFSINQTIKDWEEDHPGYEVGFNGRSGGYLVLMNNRNNGHVFDGDYSSPCQFRPDQYDYWKETVQEEWGSLKAYHNILVDQVKIVQEFDKLCDDLIDVLRGCIEEMKDEKRRTHQFSATLRFQRYYYDTLKDLQYHMLQMKQRGYSVYEYSQEDLYAEYEMNESIESEVTVEQEGDEEFVC